MYLEEIIAKTKQSPALTEQWDSEDEFAYPKVWGGKVPFKIKATMTIRPDMPFLAKAGTIVHQGQEYYVWVNKHGAISAILGNGEQLGLKPDECEVIEYHPTQSNQS